MSNLASSIMESVGGELINLCEDYGEIALDSILDEETLKNIPVVNTIISISKIGLNIKDRFFVKKLAMFLNELSKTSHEERVKFLKNNREKKEKIGENLIILIDGLNDASKSKIIANLFKNYMQEKIDYDTFLRISQLIEKSFVGDLIFLLDNENAEELRGIEAISLKGLGLLDQASFDGGIYGDPDYVPDTFYAINQLGQLVIKYAMK